MDAQQLQEANAEINQRIRTGSARRSAFDPRGAYTAFFVDRRAGEQAVAQAAPGGIKPSGGFEYACDHGCARGQIIRFANGIEVVIRDVDQIAAAFYWDVVRPLPAPGGAPGFDFKTAPSARA